MANTITHRGRPVDEWVRMSNGLTSVVISLLSMATAELATNDWQQRHSLWIAACDQSVLGVGTVGFDVTELPWSIHRLDAEKDFWLRAIAGATKGEITRRLHYPPDQERVARALRELTGLIHVLQPEDVRTSSTPPLLDDAPELRRCTIHGAFLHVAGCVVCNDR